MEIKVVDKDTIEITPENVSEMLTLEKFAGATVEIREPEPFNNNVRKLRLSRSSKEMQQ